MHTFVFCTWLVPILFILYDNAVTIEAFCGRCDLTTTAALLSRLSRNPCKARSSSNPKTTHIREDCIAYQKKKKIINSNNNNINRMHVLYSSDDPDIQILRPRTSFGSEIVPEGQRPVNEYLDVTSQPLFGWAATKSGSMGLFLRLSVFYCTIFGLVCYPISGATFTQEGYAFQKIAASNVGAMFVVLLLVFRLYAGWEYIGQRLSSKVIEYEETGWYDGDWEEKTETEMRRDRLLFNNEVRPVVERLRNYLLGSVGLFVASIICFNVALTDKPMFNQYDPAILERLSYDDKLADTAAMKSGGKPAYCDSRYYSAVANGGMGCN